MTSAGQQPSTRSAATGAPEGGVTTNFLLGNLHCPTCVSSIKDALRDWCDGPVRWVSPNVVTSVVTVEHDAGASITQMQLALEEAGFEISGVTSSSGEVPDVPDRYQLASAQTDGARSEQDFGDGPASALVRWISPSKTRNPNRHARSRAHLSNCEQCRTARDQQQQQQRADEPEEEANETTSLVRPSGSGRAVAGVNYGSTSAMSTGSLLTVVVDSSQPSNSPLFRATLSIGGMTCASCVNAITDSMKRKDWITSAQVNLINNSAVFDVYDKGRVSELVKAVEDLGYEAVLDDVEEVHASKVDHGDLWRAGVAIGGMTCASCANTITQEMKKKDWVKDIAVNLVTNSATIVFEGKKRIDHVVSAIEDLGYEAHLDTVVDLAEEKSDQRERTVEILINGFYCEHCPSRIQNSLLGFQRDMEITRQPTMQSPTIKMTYVPEAPNFTIRHILAAIEASDPEFEASVYHPPTLEERSKMIQSRHQREILKRAIGTGIVCVPTFIIGIVYMSLVPKENASKKWLMEPWKSGINRAQVALFILSTPVYFFAASLFHKRAIKEIRALWKRGSRVPVMQRFYRFGSMNTLMSLGTTIAYVSSMVQMLVAAVTKPEVVNDVNFYFDSVVFLTFFLLVGRLIESYSKSKTGDAVEMLVKLRPTTAVLVEGYGSEKEVDKVVQADLLEFGDVVRITNGASPPADGTVVRGEGSFDESSLTGESKPVKKVAGDKVYAGTVNKDAPVLVRVTGTAGDSMLDQIVKVVREGQAKRAPMEQIADMLTMYFVPVVTLMAILTWLLWMALGYGRVIPAEYLDVTTGGWVAFSLQFAISVFVVACPCGLALAAPTAIFVGGGLAAKHGILAKGGGEAFEIASRVDCVVFDKTGTLTVGGEPTVTDSEIFHVQDDVAEEAIIMGAMKAVEENSSHPVAKAIVSFCANKASRSVQLADLAELPGKGMKASVTGRFGMIVGNEALMTDFSVNMDPATLQTLHKWKGEAKSVALVAIQKTDTDDKVPDAPWTLAAALSISDPVRPEAAAVVRALQDNGVRVWMLSGDHPTTAAAVAAQIGIPADQVMAGVLPAEKADKIKHLQSTLRARGKDGRELASRRAVVAMVGDGINDSPALATADVGVAIGSGSDVAISSAAFVLVTNDLRAVPTLLRLSRAVFARVALNFGWALVYNAVALPVAAGALYPVVSAAGTHVRLDPVWASLAMALSSISVVLSSLALRSSIPFLGFKDKPVVVA